MEKLLENVKRYTLFLIGLFVMAVGIALMVRAELGTSPISSIPYVFSLKFSEISLGVFTILWNIFLILGQVLILRRKFRWFQLVQIPLTFLFGIFVDFSKYILDFLHPQEYWKQAAVLILGCLVLALGVSFTVVAGVVMNSGEAFVNAVAQQTGKNFGTIKVFFDSALVLLSAAFSLLFFGRIVGVREGTVIAALLSGFIIRFFNRLLTPVIERWFCGSRPKEEQNFSQSG